MTQIHKVDNFFYKQPTTFKKRNFLVVKERSHEVVLTEF